METMIQLLQEEIYGNMATVYHRTDYSNLVNSIYTKGFKTGSGKAYGEGFYATYDLKSQEKPGMETSYGSTVVKFAVPLTNFFFFDWSEFKKTRLQKELKATEKDFMEKQIAHYKITMRAGTTFKKEKTSAGTASTLFTWSDLGERVRGLVFTSTFDGRTIVSYEPKTIIPMAYRTGDEDEEWEKAPKNKAYVKKANIAKHDVPDIKQRHKVSTKWVEKANTKNGEHETWKGVLTWYGGEWLSGIWVGGVWEKGIWRNGTWLRGEWHKGDWFNGIWKSGTWFTGRWYAGTWEGGQWHNGWIRDVNKKGNFDKSWRWDSNDEFVYSPISPKEYWEGKQQ